VKRLCGSGVVGHSELFCGEPDRPGTLLGTGLGCLKLLLSENSDWDSAEEPSKGERTMRPLTLMGITRLCLLRPGGGDGESLQGNWRRQKGKYDG